MFTYQITHFQDSGEETYCHFMIYLDLGRQPIPVLATSVRLPSGADEAAVVATVEGAVREYAELQRQPPKQRFPALEGKRGKV